MKKLSVLFLSAVALTATFTSCSKDEAAPATPVATSLEVTVVAPDGTTPLIGATTKLYDASDSSMTVLATGITDSTGKCIFDTNLSSKTYVVTAITPGGAAGCKSGVNGTSTAIPLNQKTSLKVTTVSKGSVQFVNKNATNSYNLYVQKNDGTFLKIIATPLSPSGTPGDTTAQSIVTLGTYTFKAVQADASGNDISTDPGTIYTQNVATECTNYEVDIN